MFKKSIVFLFVFLICFLPQVNGANAQEESALPFVVKPILTKEQSKDIQSYFDINVKPDKDYRLQVKIENTTNEPINVKMQVANAYTASNGGIVYSPLTKETQNGIIDPLYQLSNCAELEQKEVVLKAGEQKSISIKVHVPNIKMGTVLGGILFSTEEATKETKKQGDLNFSLNSKTKYAMAIQLNVGKKPKTELSINSSKIENTPTGAKIFMSLTNKSASILKDVNVQYTVKKEKKDLFKGNFTLSKIAPMSNVQYQIPWVNTIPEKGRYQIELRIKVDSIVVNKTIDMEVKNDKKFVMIKGEESKPILKDLEKPKTILSSPYFYVFLGIFITVALFSLIKFLPMVIRRRKHE